MSDAIEVGEKLEPIRKDARGSSPGVFRVHTFVVVGQTFLNSSTALWPPKPKLLERA